VLAKGLFDPSSKTVVATWIEIVTLEAGLPRVAGTIGEFKSLADFRIGAQAIDASGATLVDATAAEFGSGAVVEAVGGVSEIGGVRVLQATRLRLLGK